MTTLDYRPPTTTAEFVETTTGPALPPPMPNPTVIDGESADLTNPHMVHVYGALGALGVSLAGLVTTAVAEPSLVGWPIGTTFAAAVAAGAAAVVHDRWATRHTLKPV